MLFSLCIYILNVSALSKHYLGVPRQAPVSILSLRIGRVFLSQHNGSHELARVHGVRENSEERVRTVYQGASRPFHKEHLLLIQGCPLRNTELPFNYERIITEGHMEVISSNLLMLKMGNWDPQRLRELAHARGRASSKSFHSAILVSVPWRNQFSRSKNKC